MGALSSRYMLPGFVILIALTVVSAPKLLNAYSLAVEYPHRVECHLSNDGGVSKSFYIYPKSLKTDGKAKSLIYSAKKSDVSGALEVSYSLTENNWEFSTAKNGSEELQTDFACSAAEMLPKIILLEKS